MRRWRVSPAIVLLSMSFAARVGYTADEPPVVDVAKSFDAEIGQLDTLDPRAPQALEAHLRYAAYLSQRAGAGCGVRLANAETQLQAAQKNVALSVVMPQGLARAADVEYQLHTAQATCPEISDSARRDEELRAALDSAQRAAALYEDTFDYPAMLTMRFNAAVTQRSLGNAAAARAALKSVIDADRLYGFRDDAEENARLLLDWSKADSAAADTSLPGLQEPSSSGPSVAAVAQDFPQRSTTLNFAWVPGENTVTIKIQSTWMIEDGVLKAEGGRTLTRRVQKRHSRWLVTYQSQNSHYALEPAYSKAVGETSFTSWLAAMLTQCHDYSLTSKTSKAGMSAGFDGAINAKSFEARVQKDEDAYQWTRLLQRSDPPGTAGFIGPVASRGMTLEQFLKPWAVESRAALDYKLEAGAWQGATLEQGQWYGMKLLLPLPFSPLNFVLHEVQFAFTRELPCNQDSNRTCVEIVLRAVPDEAEFNSFVRQLLHGNETLRARWTTYRRLITDPATLQAYHSDTRSSFYVWIDGPKSPQGPSALLGADQTAMDFSVVTPANN